LDFAGEGFNVAFGAIGPGGALFDPEAEGFFFVVEEAVFDGGHGAFFAVLEEDELVKRAGAGVPGDDEGAVGTGFEGEGFGFEIEMAEEEAGVVAGEAIFLEDGFDVGDEVDGLDGNAGLIRGVAVTGGEGGENDEAEGCAEEGGSLHKLWGVSS
jgi:hypothetical protein